jgi:hypothetical protein
MRIVGDRLAQIAAASSDPTHFDLFGRSAFNRYYYSAFLSVRATLRRMDSRWAAPAHKDVPIVLKGEVLQRLKRTIQLSSTNGQISRAQGAQMYHAAATAASELSNLLTAAREIRRIADYQPELPVAKQGAVVKLADCTLDAAKSWEKRAEMQAKTILRVYGQLGLI